MYFIKLWHKRDYYFSKYSKLVALSSVFLYLRICGDKPTVLSSSLC